VDARLYNMWEELVGIASSLVLTSEEDQMVWQYQSSGLYSSHSLYRVINFRGVTPVFIPVVLEIDCPPKGAIFSVLSGK
jgi:hypothetical protein